MLTPKAEFASLLPFAIPINRPKYTAPNAPDPNFLLS